MTDLRTNDLTHSVNLKQVAVKALMAIFSGIAICAPSIQAAELDWWFDVEVIIFERQLDPASILEQFEQTQLSPPSGDMLDLLTPYLKPDLGFIRAGLPYCMASKNRQVQQQYQQDLASEVDTSLETETASHTEQQTTGNFEYQVASADIFTENPTSQVDEKQQSQPNTRTPPVKKILPNQPILVEWIEWQIPDALPCVYSQQVDPTLRLLTHTESRAQQSQSLPQIQKVPVQINGQQWPKKRGAFLLPKDTFLMPELFTSIQKQRDITPILHLNWRQEVLFGRENAQTFRVFAGQNFAGQFDKNGHAIIADTDQLIASLQGDQPENALAPIEIAPSQVSEQRSEKQAIPQGPMLNAPSPDEFFAKIDAALNDDSPINFALVEDQTDQQVDTDEVNKALEDIWQIDGGITVYLQNVGRVPYLHIDSQLDYRHAISQSAQSLPSIAIADDSGSLPPMAINPPQQANYLQSVPFNQLRRVISKQVHYFDHPLFGMIVRINRHHWPEQPGTLEDSSAGIDDN